MTGRRFRPLKSGHGCQLRLPEEERTLLELLPRELEGVIKSLDVSSELPRNLRRLFPPAYVRDEDAQKAYSEATRNELVHAHQEALSVLAGSARASALDEEQMVAWMTALNELRLVLGSVLDVDDEEPWEPEDPDDTDVMIYQYLTALQSELIDVMEDWLPDPVPGADDLVPDDPWGEPLGGLRWDGTPQPEWPPRPSL